MMKTKLIFRAEIQNLKPSEILDMISVSVFNMIKGRDDSPEFRAYIIGHEGEADAKMLGTGRQIFKYFRQAITNIWDKLTIGTPIFRGHGKETNSYDYRNPIGEVVGKALTKIDDKLTAIAAVYIEPSERKSKLDIASIEADVLYERIDNEMVKVNSIDQITGIALGNSETEMPGFAGAKLLGAIQALKVTTHHSKEKPVEKSEIIQAIKDGKFTPSDIFTIDDLKRDSNVIEHVKAEKQTQYEHAKRVEKKLGEEREEFTKKENELNSKIDGLKRETIKTGMKDVFSNIATERKLSDKQKLFIEKNIGDFNTEKTESDEVKLDLNKFIDSQLVTYSETAKLFGVDVSENNEGKKGGESNDDVNTSPTDQTGGGDDLTDPKNNPFIA